MLEEQCLCAFSFVTEHCLCMIFFLNLNLILVKAVTSQQCPLTLLLHVKCYEHCRYLSTLQYIITDTNALLVRLIHSLLASCNVVTLYRVELF